MFRVGLQTPQRPLGLPELVRGIKTQIGGRLNSEAYASRAVRLASSLLVLQSMLALSRTTSIDQNPNKQEQ